MSGKFERKDIYNDLFDYDSWEDGDQTFMMFSGITMKKDFGPLKKDQTFTQIEFNAESGTCQTYDKDYKITNKFSYGLTA